MAMLGVGKAEPIPSEEEEEEEEQQQEEAPA